MVKKKTPNIKSVTVGNVEWVHVTNHERKNIDALRRGFDIHPIDLKEILPPLQRPKLVPREDYLFMILLYPVYDRKTGTIFSSEVDFIIGRDHLITVNADALPPLVRLFEAGSRSSKDEERKKKLCGIDGVSHVLYLILDDLLEEVSPILIHLSEDIDKLERRMFQEFEKGLIEELLRVKTNIVNVRKALQGHKSVIRNLIRYSEGRFPIGELEVYFERLVEQTKELWDTLEVQRDTINALHETNASLIDFRINEIMKTLTIFAVLVFPLTLIAAVFGMNVQNMPLVGHPQGFWLILGLMALGVLGMIWFFRKMKWL
ncbi:magnesium transporter CorA family protein [Candidatus Uhrbacteria bacterium]|nr:magnesium transporter CorA family protein [Candidatus Uhrbacteria bacterium]